MKTDNIQKQDFYNNFTKLWQKWSLTKLEKKTRLLQYFYSNCTKTEQWKLSTHGLAIGILQAMTTPSWPACFSVADNGHQKLKQGFFIERATIQWPHIGTARNEFEWAAHFCVHRRDNGHKGSLCCRIKSRVLAGTGLTCTWPCTCELQAHPMPPPGTEFALAKLWRVALASCA